MEWNKKSIRNCIFIVCIGVLFYSILQHFGIVCKAVSNIFKLIWPFLLGGAIAFILNVPMRAIEKRLFPKSKRFKRLRRVLALIITLILVSAIITLAIFVIFPGIIKAIANIFAQIPIAFGRLEQWLLQYEEYLPQLEKFLLSLELNWKEIYNAVIKFITDLGTNIITASGQFISYMISAIATFLIAFIFSIYILLQKEKLGSHLRQIIYALFPEHKGDKYFEIVKLSDTTFSHFLSGQCLEACILGSLFVITMTIFKLPYAFLIGFLITVTALIPIIGAFIGCIVGALLIAITSPIQALFFIILFLILQQIEGNLIYPHVVGSSVGLPSIWVLVAVTLGGKLMGIGGMLLFIPLCSVCYALFRSFVKDRLNKKEISKEKWQGPSLCQKIEEHDTKDVEKK